MLPARGMKQPSVFAVLRAHGRGREFIVIDSAGNAGSTRRQSGRRTSAGSVAIKARNATSADGSSVMAVVAAGVSAAIVAGDGLDEDQSADFAGFAGQQKLCHQPSKAMSYPDNRSACGSALIVGRRQRRSLTMHSTVGAPFAGSLRP